MRATQNTSSDSEHFVKTNLSGPWTISGPCICKKKYESHSDPEHFRTLPQTQNTSSDSEHFLRLRTLVKKNIHLAVYGYGYSRKSMRATQNTSSDSEHFVKTNLSGPWTISCPCICKKKYESHSDPEHFRTLPQTQNTSSDSEH